MMIKILLLVTCIFFNDSLLAKTFEQDSESTSNKKVLLVGIDGLQFQYLQKLTTPNINRLFIQKVYTGGIVNQQTEQATSSGPAWATIMTGVWSNKHGITANNSDLANTQFPSLYQRIYEHNSSALMYGFSTWQQTHSRYFKNNLSLLVEESHGGTDDLSFQKTLLVLKEKPADFIFLHLDDVDLAGHSYCFGKEYEQAILKVDEQVGMLLAAIEARKIIAEFQGEDWLVLLVTDHGRDAQGCGHGSQTEDEKTVFIASNKQFHETFLSKSKSNVQTFNGLYDYLPQTMIAPTVLGFLGITIKDEWLLEGSSLFKTASLRSLSETDVPHEFSWFVDDNFVNENVEIFRNNQLIDKVLYTQRKWRDRNPDKYLNDYQFKFNGVSIAYRIKELSLVERIIKKFEATKEKFLVILERVFSPFIRFVS